MKMVTNCSTREDLDAAIDEVLDGIICTGDDPSLVILSCTVAYDVPAFYDKMGLSEKAPKSGNYFILSF